MRIRAAVAAVGLVLIAQLASGCGTPSPTPVATAKPSASPVFASDEEALAAAEKALRSYLATSDQIANGADVATIESVVTSQQFEEEKKGSESYTSAGIRAAGQTKMTNLVIESVRNSVDGSTIRAYLCSDSSDVRILDSSGDDVTPSSRPDTQTLEVTLVSAGDNPRRLLIGELKPWSGQSIC